MNRALALGCLVFLMALFAFHATLNGNVPREPLPEVDPAAPLKAIRVTRTDPLSAAERAEGERVLRLFWERWGAERARHELSQAMGVDCIDLYPGHFEREPYQPEFRLWVRGYPAIADEWARKAIVKSDYRSENGGWAFFAIVELARVGYAGAAELLNELAGDRDYAGWARPVLRELKELSREVDPHVPDSVARHMIRESINGCVDERFEWALRFGRVRGVPWLEEVLRERMYRGRSEAWIPKSPVRDETYDLCLLTLAESGAPLGSEERAYLKHFGYGCEPRARLDEVLREKGY